MQKWQKLSSRYVLENRWYKVRQDKVVRPDGQEGEYNVVECGRSVFIVPVTHDGKILLIKLFRYTTQREGWEVPAGGVEQGEEPLAAAKRELKEETGLVSDDWEEVAVFDSMNGMTDALGHVFEVRNLADLNPADYDVRGDDQAEEGITDMRAFSPEEVVRMIREGQILDAPSIAALMCVCVKHGLKKIELDL